MIRIVDGCDPTVLVDLRSELCPEIFWIIIWIDAVLIAGDRPEICHLEILEKNF